MTDLREWTIEKNNRNRPAKNKGFEVVKFITDGEYRADRDYKDYKNSEYKESEKLFNTLEKGVQIVIVKCYYNVLELFQLLF